MSWIAALVSAIAASTATFLVAWLAWPKTKAEAGLIGQQAEDAVWARWHREIARLEEIIRGQGKRIAALEQDVRSYALREIDLLKELARKDDRIAELEATAVPRSAIGGHPVEGVAAALRQAHAVDPDVEGLRMRDALKNVKRSGE